MQKSTNLYQKYRTDDVVCAERFTQIEIDSQTIESLKIHKDSSLDILNEDNIEERKKIKLIIAEKLSKS